MDESPGWDAIDNALRPLYGDASPLHLATLHKWSLGGPDPLDGISVYPRMEPVPHWHFVSYGMSELYAKESENPDESGWGFEFTFRVARDPAEEKPPMWAPNMLQNLARYVFKSGNWFEPGHHIDANGPINADRHDSEIRAVTFVTDPELGEISTPHGSVVFLQAVGLATEEYAVLRKWNVDELMKVLAPHLPLFVTDIDRRSLLAHPEVARAVQEGSTRDGSSSGLHYVPKVGWERTAGSTTLRLGANHAPQIADSLRGRLPFGRELILQGDDARLTFRPGDVYAVEEPLQGALDVHVPLAALDDLTAVLRPVAGRTAVASLPGLTVEIVPTVIKDRYGNDTDQVIG
ncbi:suppressor of fused domain protein [Spirillospora sp. NPDC048819]|uniref:suppressor of fused domain protein n=1 Tax=Spirillospora sp. NPDC048819 TaxID=3155268 RepID=UPI0033F0003D